MSTPFRLKIPQGLSPQLEKIAGMLFGEIPPFKALFQDRELRDAVFSKVNPVLLKEGKGMLQNMFDQIVEGAPGEIFRTEALIGNLLCYYALLQPQQGEILKVPHWIHSRWTAVDYQVQPIRLTPPWLGGPLYAYGLMPPSNSEAPPRLIFKGTGYPAEEGFGLQIMADFTPGCPVGFTLFHFGKKAIGAWLKEAGGGVWACGISLGGAMTELTALYYPQYIARGDAYGAEALYSFLFSEDSEFKPPVNVYTQPNDPVFMTGLCWPEHWKLWRVVSQQIIRNPFVAHMRCNLADPQGGIVELDHAAAARDPWRYFFTFGHHLVSIPVFLIGLLNWGIRRCWKWAST